MHASLRRTLVGLPFVGMLVLVVGALTPCIATCGGHDEAVTEVVRRCPRARALIGDDARPARLGFACGETETSSRTGTASWTMNYTGARGQGEVSYVAIKRAGDWQVEHAELSVGDEAIDLLACVGTAAASLVQTSADEVHAGFEGRVLRSTHPTIVTGGRCQGRLDRERGATTAHVVVRCPTGTAERTDTQPLYDGTGRVTLDVRSPSRRDDDRVEFADDLTSDTDGTPGCRFSGAGSTGTLTVWDAGYELVLAL